MDLCKYAYYSDKKEYFPILYCRLRGESGRCVYSKKCLKVERFVPLENEMWKECGDYIMEKRKEIPNGSNFVQTYRPNRSGKLYLYVVIDNKVEKILSNLTELNQDYVYIRKSSQGNYEVSLTPFKVEAEIKPEIIKEPVQIEEVEFEEINKIESIPVKKNNRGRKKKEIDK